MKNIFERICEHRDYVISQGYNSNQILGVFLYGSQNYKLDTPYSDIDTKVVIIPTIEQLAFQPERNKVLILPNREHCEVMSIVNYITNLLKQNINFVETLFTNYYWVNERYSSLWNEYFIENRERIARYCEKKAIISISSQAAHTLKQNPSDGKKVGNAYRLLYFLKSYIQGKDYLSCMVPTETVRSVVYNLKSNQQPITTEIAESVSNGLIRIMEEIQEAPLKMDNEIADILKEGAVKMIKKNDYLIL